MLRCALVLVVLPACFDLAEDWAEDRSDGHDSQCAKTLHQLLPGIDGRIAVTLEPMKRTGIWNTGSETIDEYETKLVGPTVAVDLDTTPVVSFEPGTTRVFVGSTRAWVVQTAVSEWRDYSASDKAPGPFAILTPVDRSTLSAEPAVLLEPPLAEPFVIGDDLLDRTWSSDIGTDLVVRRRTSDGGATVLFSARGRDLAVCSRNAQGMVVAYQEEYPSDYMHLVSLQRDAGGVWSTKAEATFYSWFTPEHISCDARHERAAIETRSSVRLFDIPTATIVFDLATAHGPLALRSDGTAFVAMRWTDGHLIARDATSTRDLGITVSGYTDTPTNGRIVDDLALFAPSGGYQVVDLAALTLGPRIERVDSSPTVARWRDGHGFVVMQNDSPTTGTLAILDASTATEIQMPTSQLHELVVPDGGHAYVKMTHFGGGAARVFSVDLAARAPLFERTLPVCDADAILAERGCQVHPN